MVRFKDKMINLRSVSLWIAIAALVLGFLVTYSWQINSQFDGFSVAEVSSVENSMQLNLNNFIDAPYQSIQYLSLKIFRFTSLGVRLPSILFGLSSIVLFYLLIRQLTNKNISLFATVMFASSSWMLHLSRHGDSTITNIFWPIAILLIAYNVYKFHLDWFWYVIAGIVLGLAAYTPRMIYFVAFAIIVAILVFHRYEAKMHKQGALGGLLAFIIMLTPLGYSLYTNTSQIPVLLALPPETLLTSDIITNFLSSLSTLAWQSSLPNYLNLGALPVFNIIELALATLGLLVLFTDIRAPRSWLLLVMLSGSLAVMTLTSTGVTNVYIVMPIASILGGIGLFTLWTRWREVFPSNKAARSAAVSGLAILVLFSTTYHFERYFLAWSNVPETKQDFSNRLSQDGTIINEMEKE